MIHGTGMLLLSVIGGYWMLERAENHKGELRRIGRLLGGLVIVVGLFESIVGVWGGCPWKKAGWSCPFSRQMHQSGAKPETIMVTPEVRKKR